MSSRALVLLAGGLGLVALTLVDPAHISLVPPCLFHELTGLHCPGCGGTRALHQLLNGHLAAAFAYNPLAVVALPFAAAWFAARGVAERRGRTAPGLSRGAVFTLAAVVVVYGVLRNLPFEPFRQLAPHAIAQR